MILSQMQGAVGDPLQDECNQSTIPPSKSILSTRRGYLVLHKGERTLMENTQDELKAHLMKTDEEFRHLAEQHAEYHTSLRRWKPSRISLRKRS